MKDLKIKIIECLTLVIVFSMMAVFVFWPAAILADPTAVVMSIAGLLAIGLVTVLAEKILAYQKGDTHSKAI